MSIKTYIVGANNKISISHTYAKEDTYQLVASDNIVELDIGNIIDPATQLGEDKPNLLKYTSIYLGSNIIKIASKCCYMFTYLENIQFNSKIESLGPSAFYKCTALTSIDMPDSLSTIGQNAFEGCNALVDVQFPQHKMSIGNNAFNGTGIESLKVLVDDAFGSNAFSNCTQLREADIDGSLANYAFSGCTSLEKVLIGNQITSIPENCFNGCTNLVDVEFSNAANIQAICNNAFFNCSELSDLHLKDMKLLSIGSNAFYGMQITTIVLPSTITSPTQLDPQFLAGTSVISIKFLGMKYDDMWKVRTQFSSFGSSVGLSVSIYSSEDKKYGLDSTGLKRLDATAVVLMIAMTRNSTNRLDDIIKDVKNFKDEINAAYKGKESLILGTYLLSDPGYKGSNAVANKKNIDAYFDKAAKTGADLLIFMFSDHGVDQQICIYNSSNTGLDHYSYANLYNQFKKFKYVFAQLNCCYPNSAPDSVITSFKSSNSKALVWAGATKDQVTFCDNGGHQLEVLIKDYFKSSYTWAQMFNKIKDKKLGGWVDKNYYLTNIPQKYNYNNFPESSPVFRIIQS